MQLPCLVSFSHVLCMGEGDTLSPLVRAVCQALLVTFLWSRSTVLIKIGLADIAPLPFAGLRRCAACPPTRGCD